MDYKKQILLLKAGLLVSMMPMQGFAGLCRK